MTDFAGAAPERLAGRRRRSGWRSAQIHCAPRSSRFPDHASKHGVNLELVELIKPRLTLICVGRRRRAVPTSRTPSPRSRSHRRGARGDRLDRRAPPARPRARHPLHQRERLRRPASSARSRSSASATGRKRRLWRSGDRPSERIDLGAAEALREPGVRRDPALRAAGDRSGLAMGWLPPPATATPGRAAPVDRARARRARGEIDVRGRRRDPRHVGWAHALPVARPRRPGQAGAFPPAMRGRSGAGPRGARAVPRRASASCWAARRASAPGGRRLRRADDRAGARRGGGRARRPDDDGALPRARGVDPAAGPRRHPRRPRRGENCLFYAAVTPILEPARRRCSTSSSRARCAAAAGSRRPRDPGGACVARGVGGRLRCRRRGRFRRRRT